MRHLHAHRVSIPRRGMSLVEMILVIIGLLLLLSLFLPAMRQARGPARRVQCLSNLKNLALAIQNYASGHHGKLPLLTEPAPGLASRLGKTTWALTLMPYLDRADTHEYITLKETPEWANMALKAVLENSFRELQCPDDVQHFKQPGGMSYGANIGYGPWRGISNGITATYKFGAKDHSAGAIDWNLNGKLDPLDKEITRATGVFWLADDDGFVLSLDDINEGDGTSQTILLAESLNLPPMHLSGPAKDGLNPGALETGIGLGLDALGIVPKAKPALFMDQTATANSQYTQYFRPSGTRDTTFGGWPRASSYHRGVVNVVFAGGNASPISNEINWAVWASLHSPRGVQYGQAKIQESDF